MAPVRAQPSPSGSSTSAAAGGARAQEPTKPKNDTQRSKKPPRPRHQPRNKQHVIILLSQENPSLPLPDSPQESPEPRHWKLPETPLSKTSELIKVMPERAAGSGVDKNTTKFLYLPDSAKEGKPLFQSRTIYLRGLIDYAHSLKGYKWLPRVALTDPN